MRKTKSFFILLGLLLTAGSISVAQQESPERAVVPFSNPAKTGLVEAEIMRGSITVKGYEGKDVIVEARMREKVISEESEHKEAIAEPRMREKEVSEKKEAEAKASGMKQIEIGTSGLTIEEENNVITVEVESWKRAVDLVLQVPYSTSLKLSNQMGGGITVDGVNGEITATNISGTVVADTMNGEIKVTFLKINPDKAMSFSTMNGDIDITLPADVKASLKFKSERGSIYSDFDISLKQVQEKKEAVRREGGKYRLSFEKAVVGIINGGGPEIQFNTFNGNIFIRKAK